MRHTTPPLDSPAYYSDVATSDYSSTTSTSPTSPSFPHLQLNGIPSSSIIVSNRGNKVKRTHSTGQRAHLPKRFKTATETSHPPILSTSLGAPMLETSYGSMMRPDGRVSKTLGKKGGRKLEALALGLVGLVENERPLMRALGRTVDVLEGGKHLGKVWTWRSAEEMEGERAEGDEKDGLVPEDNKEPSPSTSAPPPPPLEPERLINPDLLLKDVFVSPHPVSLDFQQVNPTTGETSVVQKEVGEEEQLELAKEAIRELVAFFGEGRELEERTGEMRAGVLEVERRRRAIGNVGRLLVKDAEADFK
ncbi:hypothetical protein BT69DRAFT_1283386 [Atractiella rhizophila]|nr:hypothetical protein BT69DRAFT_1283386 [Atractiella rhizophila]